jgi:hypothetical protein
MITEAAEKPKATRNRRPKGQSMPVMRELIGLMDQRTAIMNQMRTKRMELAQLEVSMQTLAAEIQWRASIFNMTPLPEGAAPFQPSPGAPSAVAGVQFAPPQPFIAPPSAGVIFNEGPPPPTGRSFNRGSAAADLAGMS